MMYIYIDGGKYESKLDPIPEPITKTFSPWVKKFAFTPIEINGEKVWFTHYYQRTKTLAHGDNVYQEIETATFFDILKG